MRPAPRRSYGCRARYAACALAALLAPGQAAHAAEEWRRPDSPYRMGEAYPDVAATCETAKYWIDHAPETDDRVSFAIEGKLVDVQWDGALAYLLLCASGNVQVLCVTYSRDGREIGDTVLFGGGYSRVGERQIMLDPCLASEEE